MSIRRSSASLDRSPWKRAFLLAAWCVGLQSAQSQTTPTPPAAEKPPHNLCVGEELPIFSCVLQRTKKIVSLCASEDLDNNNGYLQFRYGKSETSIDLRFPKARTHPRKHFKYFFEEVPRGETSAISFHIGSYRYSLFRSSSVYGFDGAGIIMSMQNDKIYRRFTFSRCEDDSIEVLTDWKTSFRNFNLLSLDLPDAAGDISYIGAEPDEDISSPKPGEPERKR